MQRCISELISVVVLICLSFTGAFAEGHNLKASFLQIPLSFVKNEGQKHSSILYYEQGVGHVTAFTKRGISFSLSKLSRLKEKNNNPEVVTLTPVAASYYTIEAVDKKEAKVNYLRGNDPKRWRTNIPTFGAILYRNIYPGIDMKFYGTNNQLEYDIIVSPHADPSVIRLSYDNIEKLFLRSSGDLDISLKKGSLLQKKPRIYQTIDNVIREIEGKFILAGNTYSFAIGLYDKDHPLIIDPVLIYSTYLGGSGDDFAHAIAVDAAGSAYLAGYTFSDNFPTQDPYQVFHEEYMDAFVTKFDPSGSALVYSTYLGGSKCDTANAIAVDSAGYVYIAGDTHSYDFPTVNPHQGTYGENTDAFVTKLNPSGNALVYSTYLGGSLEDNAYAIAIDTVGNAYVSGRVKSSNFPTKDPYQGSYGGGTYDAFVAKVGTSGNLVYSTYLGGGLEDVAYGIAIDSAGNSYVSGSTQSINFPTQEPYQGTYGGGAYDAFMAKFTSSGNLACSTYLGGSSDDFAHAIAVDSAGQAYVTGYTLSDNFPLKDPFQETYGGNTDAFVTKFDPSGSTLVYSTFMGGSYRDEAYAIAIDGSGNTHVAGHTQSINFPTLNPHQASHAGGIDAFFTKLDPFGSSIIYSTYVGGTSDDFARGITLHTSGDVYLTGYTLSDNFPSKDPFQGSLAGSYDAFFAKFTTEWIDQGIRGTVGTQITMTAINDTGFGNIQGKVFIGNNLAGNKGNRRTKIISWTASSITFEIKKALPAGTYSILVQPKEPKKAPPIVYEGAFTMMAPEIVSIDPDSGLTGDTIVISGNYFGSRKPKVYFEDPYSGKRKNCKVTWWNMVPSTGVSELAFLVPNPSISFPASSYALKVYNKVQTGETTFTIEP